MRKTTFYFVYLYSTKRTFVKQKRTLTKPNNFYKKVWYIFITITTFFIQFNIF